VKEALVIVSVFIRVVQKVKTQRKCAETVCISVRIAPFQSCELRKHANTKWCLKSGLQYSNIPSKCAATDCSSYVKFDKPSVVRTEKNYLKMRCTCCTGCWELSGTTDINCHGLCEGKFRIFVG